MIFFIGIVSMKTVAWFPISIHNRNTHSVEKQAKHRNVSVPIFITDDITSYMMKQSSQPCTLIYTLCIPFCCIYSSNPCACGAMHLLQKLQ